MKESPEIEMIAKRAAAAEFSHDHPDVSPGDAAWADLDVQGYVSRAREKVRSQMKGESSAGVAARYARDDWAPSEHEAAVLEAL